jgi:hypothetical protein
LETQAAVSERELGLLLRAGRTPRLVDVPELAFLALDGHGDPNVSASYRDALQALFTVSYTLKFEIKRAGGPVFRVAPLEGLWSVPDMAGFAAASKADWDWTMMIRQPPVVTPELLQQAATQAAERRDLPLARELRLKRFAEGRAAQILHIGPYAAEAPTIEALHAFIAAQGLVRRGRHHEIYLGDPRRAAPERLRTIIRQPVEPA